MSQESSTPSGKDESAAPSPDSFQPKKPSTIVRVLTVIAYLLSVSLVAIFLSTYYVFVYDPKPTLAFKSYPLPKEVDNKGMEQISPRYREYEQHVYGGGSGTNITVTDRGVIVSYLMGGRNTTREEQNNYLREINNSTEENEGQIILSTLQNLTIQPNIDDEDKNNSKLLEK